jgi:hypothetical protein
MLLEVDWAAVARVACWRGPWGANVLLLGVSFALEGDSASLEGDFYSHFYLIRDFYLAFNVKTV